MDDGDSGRYVELMRRTAKYVVAAESGHGADSRPKLKHIVLPSWVNESLEEETLMDEDCEWSRRPRLTISAQAGVEACMDVFVV